MMATRQRRHSERITPQFVSSALDVQEKMRVWANRAIQDGFSEDESTGNRITLRRRPRQAYLAIIFGPIIGFLYGSFMYGSYAGLIYGAIFGLLGICGFAVTKPTVVTAYWLDRAPFEVTMEASASGGDFKNVVNDLKYVLSTDPGTALQ